MEAKWTYKGFFITEIENLRGGVCARCGRDITYNYILISPQHREIVVGMECIERVLDHNTYREALRKFKHSQNQIVKHRFQNRLSLLTKKISTALLDALVLKIEGRAIPAKQVIARLHQKISDNILPSRMEIQSLQYLEKVVRV